MCNNTDSSCISEILTVINILQDNAECSDSCLDTCDRGFLGNTVSTLGLNTRPVMLYTSAGGGTPWKMPTTTENIDCSTGGNCSSVFRVEKVDGDCATFRVLMANPDVSASYPYVATNSFFTMNLKCVCCLKCLNDTYVDAV